MIVNVLEREVLSAMCVSSYGCAIIYLSFPLTCFFPVVDAIFSNMKKCFHDNSWLKSWCTFFYRFRISFYKWSSWAAGPKCFHGSRKHIPKLQGSGTIFTSVVPVIRVTILVTVSSLTGEAGTLF